MKKIIQYIGLFYWGLFKAKKQLKGKSKEQIEAVIEFTKRTLMAPTPFIINMICIQIEVAEFITKTQMDTYKDIFPVTVK